MNQIRLYIDEDAADRALVRNLLGRGVNVLTVVEAQMESATDEQQLIFGTSQGRSVYSLNFSDFCRLHSELLAAGKEHVGNIVIPRQRYLVGDKIRRLGNLIDTVTAEQMRNRLEFL